MGKRKGSQTHTSLSDDDLPISSDQLLRKFLQEPKKSPSVHLTPPTFNLKSFEDRRTWHPEQKQRPPQSTARAHRAIKIAPPAKTARPGKLPTRLAFTAPKHVVLCVRRNQRKQVLFAKKLTRAGAGSKRRRTSWSDIKC